MELILCVIESSVVLCEHCSFSLLLILCLLGALWHVRIPPCRNCFFPSGAWKVMHPVFVMFAVCCWLMEQLSGASCLSRNSLSLSASDLHPLLPIRFTSWCIETRHQPDISASHGKAEEQKQQKCIYLRLRTFTIVVLCFSLFLDYHCIPISICHDQSHFVGSRVY